MLEPIYHAEQQDRSCVEIRGTFPYNKVYSKQNATSSIILQTKQTEQPRQLYNMDVTKVKVKAVDNVYHLEISIDPTPFTFIQNNSAHQRKKEKAKLVPKLVVITFATY